VRAIPSGPYVLARSAAQPLPLTITDSTGRRIRVFADTLTVNGGQLTYHSSGVAAITPPGGIEQPAAVVAISERGFTQSGPSVAFPATIGGPASGSVQGTTLQLRMSDATTWFYQLR
jgi:hypothetical protein